MDSCTIVFAKNPVPNQVKTRLLSSLSPEQAASLYQAFLVDWCNAFFQIAPADLVIAYTPPESRDDLQNLIGDNAIYTPQVGIGLGERLTAAAQWAREHDYTKFVFVGSDSPTLPIQYVERAFELLDSQDVVIGPSIDGGYYLIGFSAHGAALAIPTVFEEITWSTNVVFRQTLEKIQAVKGRLGVLPPWYDIDTPATLQLLHDHLFAMYLAGDNIPAPQTHEKLTKWLR